MYHQFIARNGEEIRGRELFECLMAMRKGDRGISRLPRPFVPKLFTDRANGSLFPAQETTRQRGDRRWRE